MNILTTSASAQSLVIVPRRNAASVSVVLKNETTNSSEVEAVSPTYADGYMTISAAWVLKAQTFYLLEVFDTTVPSPYPLIYRGRVFCTNQTDMEKFTVNADIYTPTPVGNNEYIVI